MTTTITERPPITEADLRQFTGTEQWYRHPINSRVLFTDGAKFVADRCGAYWLLDELALAQRFNRKVALEEFQVWKLKRTSGNRAMLRCEDGNGNKVFAKQIAYTDFPMDEIELWVEADDAKRVILLPSEH